MMAKTTWKRGKNNYQPYDENERPHSRSPPVFLRGALPEEEKKPEVKISEFVEHVDLNRTTVGQSALRNSEQKANSRNNLLANSPLRRPIDRNDAVRGSHPVRATSEERLPQLQSFAQGFQQQQRQSVDLRPKHQHIRHLTELNPHPYNQSESPGGLQKPKKR